ncbi:Nuclease HARBI1 [Phytophthora megakarya]|uniref:Nuclease HARBI1 n=1 Tax=Phytophthora megakarya TaxID=4795 RepID=A0A225VCP6_9STRA|nr:Nuclease HARBI1 [Phytophthora megakarya]
MESSDDELETRASDGRNEQMAPIERKQGGSVPGKAANMSRDFEDAHNKLWTYYFAESPRFPEKYFRRRYRMRRSLFIRIMDAVVARDAHFHQLQGAIGKKGLSSLQTCTPNYRLH